MTLQILTEDNAIIVIGWLIVALLSAIAVLIGIYWRDKASQFDKMYDKILKVETDNATKTEILNQNVKHVTALFGKEERQGEKLTNHEGRIGKLEGKAA